MNFSVFGSGGGGGILDFIFSNCYCVVMNVKYWKVLEAVLVLRNNCKVIMQ